MCATAAYWAGIRKIVYAMTQDDLQAFSKKNGNAIHKYRPSPIRISVEQMKVDFGIECVQVMRDECLEMLYGRKLKVDKKGRLV